MPGLRGPAIGVPRGMRGKEGRVVWQHDPQAVKWTGSGYWWEDANTDQARVEQMLSLGLRNLTDAGTDTAAWNALFRHFNRGAAGYTPGESIAIKINLNNAHDPNDNQPDATQHLVLALLKSLILEAGIPGASLVVYDATYASINRGRIPDRIFNYCRAPGGQFLNVVWVDSYGGNGRTAKVLTGNVLTYAVSNSCGAQIPTVVKDAKYLINVPLLKGHATAGVTLCAKNHYGTINTGKDHTYIDPLNTSVGNLPRYNPLVDIMGSPEIGGKTLLYLMDGLYGAMSLDTTPVRWTSAPFGNHYTASLLLSLDPVAIDTVAYDLLVAAYNDPNQTGKATSVANRLPNADNYLHEAAQADNPPSGIVYSHGGTRFQSLGVHEHADFSAPTIGQRYQTISLRYNASPVNLRATSWTAYS
ncbi:MAG: DUF362 domain-containing protein [Candidatus Sumerlaeia bacterium]|nr:DUF362 domain-containing protein [Candidatus Sumerlaeia bacterium]